MAFALLKKPVPKWELLDLGDGVSLKVEITPPTFGQRIEELSATNVADVRLSRLQCVTNWRDVFEEQESGRYEVPFSREALSDMANTYPQFVPKLLAIVAPLFVRPTTEEQAAHREE